MKEKSLKVRNACVIIGVIPIVLSLFLHMLEYGIDVSFALLRLILITVSLTAFSIKCGIDVEKGTKLGDSIFFITLCCINIVLIAIQLMK